MMDFLNGCCEKILNGLNLWQMSTSVNLYDIGWWSVIFILLLTLTIWILSNKRTVRVVESISRNLLVLSSLVWLSGVCVYLIGLYRTDLNWLSVIPRAVISSFKMFVVAHDLARVPKELQEDAIYMSIFSIVHFVAAFITFLFIFRMVGFKIKSSWNILIHKLFYSRGKVVHLFWGVNEPSCLLAESIREKHSTDTIIFVDIDEECTDNTQRKPTLSNITNTITIRNCDIARLDAIGALVDNCYNGPAEYTTQKDIDIFGLLNLKNIASIMQKSDKSYIYLFSDNEAQNISGALNLQHDKRLLSMRENSPLIYIHARRDANNEIFDHYSQYDGESHRMKIKIVDSAYLSTLALKQDENLLPVNCVEFDKKNGTVNTPFTSLIVGFGATGQEAFKFLYEYTAFIGSDMKKTPFKCYAIDEKMDKLAGIIRKKMPAIGEDELTLIKSSVDSECFWQKVNGIIDQLNYVVISLNNDAVGLSLAVNLFKHALQMRSASHLPLKILVRCYNSSNEKRMTEVVNNLNNSIKGYNIEIALYGKEKELYSYNTIISDLTLQDAKVFNAIYENSPISAEELWEMSFGNKEIQRLMNDKKMSRYHAVHDINRRIAQNISNSLHSSVKMKLMGFNENELSERLKSYYEYVQSRIYGSTVYACSEEDALLLKNMAIVEHERWVASHKLLGYTYSPENNFVKKQHKCLCKWECLDETTKSYDCNVVDTTIKMAYEKLKNAPNIN